MSFEHRLQRLWYIICTVGGRGQCHYLEFQGSSKMLVLSRKEGEKLVIGDNIGDNIVVTVNRISGNRVSIGVEAPRDIRIVRGELDRQEVTVGPNAPMSMSIDETNVMIASKPEC